MVDYENLISISIVRLKLEFPVTESMEIFIPVLKLNGYRFALLGT